MRRAGFALALLAATACGPAPTQKPHLQLAMAGERAVTLTASDGVKVFATEYRADRPKAVILLFHQAGSGKGEYAGIGPRLARAGYDTLAIDQRSGGTLYGENETVTALGRSADYLDVEPDLQAALNWARTKQRPIIVWGSSYSASLVFRLAAKNADVKALLAFSPGEYFDDKTLVERAAKSLAIPVFVTSASTPQEIAAARRLAAAVPWRLGEQYVPKAGIHGSSTLIAAKDPQGAEANWAAVMAFLRHVAP